MFFAEDIHGKADVVKETGDALREGRVPFNTYLITVTKRGRLEIISCYQAMKQINRPSELTVIGIASGRSGAFELLAEICSDWIREHGSIEGLAEYYK